MVYQERCAVGLDGRSVPRWCRETYREVGCYGPLVKRLRRRPLTPQTGVRFPHGSPNFILADSGGRYGNKASKCERISLYSVFPREEKSRRQAREAQLKLLLLTFLLEEKSVRVNGDEGTPVPIPNTVVKLIYGDNTWLATAREDNSTRTSCRDSENTVSVFYFS